MDFEYAVRKRRIGISGSEPSVIIGEHNYMGTGKNLSHLFNSINTIKDMGKYDETWEKNMMQADQVISRLEQEAKGGWHFELYCIQKIKRFGIEYGYSHFFMYVEVFIDLQSVALVSADSKEGLEKKICKIKERYSKLERDNELNDFDLDMPVLFTGQAAGIISHELLGHLFEIDNFFIYRYKKVLPLIEKLQINIMDLPDMRNGAGFYLYDDMGIECRNITICSNGKITGDLIGGNCRKTEVCHALRRDDYSKPCIPRMSNLFVSSEKRNLNMPSAYIEVTKLGKCYVNHKRSSIIIETEQNFVYENDRITGNYKQRKFNISIMNLLNKLRAVGEQNDIYPLQCQKHGQIIECGVQSMNWFVEEGMKNVILF